MTIIASLLSGLIGVIISSIFYSRLEKRKLKMETVKKMFGNKHNTSSNSFQEAMNEVMIVFSDSQDVIDAFEEFFKIAEFPLHSRVNSSADDALIKLMKVMCTDIGIKYKKLPDTYYLKCFNMPK
jgi:hypothetical protein